MFIGKVKETFHLHDRSLIVVLDTAYEELPKDLSLKIGDEVEFRGAEKVFRSTITGIELVDPWNPKNLFGFLVPLNVKDKLASGIEVWTASYSSG